MDIELSTNAPVLANDLAVGANYSILHKGGVTVEEEVAADNWQPIYAARTSDRIVILGLAGNRLRFSRLNNTGTTRVRLTALA